MKMPISEILDRLSIILLKYERTECDVMEELCTYEYEIDRLKDADLGLYLERLKEINGQIWDLEADIRGGKEGLLGLEEVGRRAIQIRDLNKKRVSIKNEIVEKYGDGFIEKKVNHGSE